MLYLLFRAGKERFCLDVSQVIEVAPLVQIKAISQAPEGILGLFNYRGTVSPLLDLSILLSGKPSQHLMSSRIIIAHIHGPKGETHVAGFLAEMVTETITRRKEELHPSNLSLESAPYLGDILFDELGMIQHIKLEKVFPGSMISTLFPENRNGSPTDQGNTGQGAAPSPGTSGDTP